MTIAQVLQQEKQIIETKMVIKLLQQSTFRRYAVKVLSPFFLFLLFSMCNYAVNWYDKLCFFAFIIINV